MVLNSVQEKQVLKNNPRGGVFFRSETGPFFVWAQPDCMGQLELPACMPMLVAELCVLRTFGGVDFSLVFNLRAICL
eukprot:COSAG02_NODE_888_length_16167_cov_293.783234_7_plen_77_part_00